MDDPKRPDEQLKEGDEFEPNSEDRLDERVEEISKPPIRHDNDPPPKAA